MLSTGNQVIACIKVHCLVSAIYTVIICYKATAALHRWSGLTIQNKIICSMQFSPLWDWEVKNEPKLQTKFHLNSVTKSAELVNPSKLFKLLWNKRELKLLAIIRRSIKGSKGLKELNASLHLHKKSMGLSIYVCTQLLYSYILKTH